MPVWSAEIIMRLLHFLSLFFCSNRKENWDVFQPHTASRDYCSSLPSGSCWSTLIETSGKVITHCQLSLRAPPAPESPKEKTGGRKHHPVPTLSCWTKHWNTQVLQGIRRHFSLSESTTLKMPGNTPEPNYSSLRTAEPQKFGTLWFTPRKCKLIFKRFCSQPLEHFPLESAGSVCPWHAGASIPWPWGFHYLLFRRYKHTFFFFPWAFSLRALLQCY